MMVSDIECHNSVYLRTEGFIREVRFEESREQEGH